MKNWHGKLRHSLSYMNLHKYDVLVASLRDEFGDICHVVSNCSTSKFCAEKAQKLESGVAFGCLVASA